MIKKILMMILFGLNRINKSQNLYLLEVMAAGRGEAGLDGLRLFCKLSVSFQNMCTNTDNMNAECRHKAPPVSV